MRLAEFLGAVESYEVEVGDHWHTAGLARAGRRGWLGVDTGLTGAPGHRLYGSRQVRRLVSWLMLLEVAGSPRPSQTEQRYQAVRLMAAAPEGWVVMADSRTSWSLVPPVATLRSRCAVAVPVPEWKH